MTIYSNNRNIKSNNIPWTEAELTDVMIRDTIQFQKKYGFEMGFNGSAWNNESDAFRHAYMQAYLTLRFGDIIAKILGKYHEIDGNINNNQDKAEEIMDLHNNSVGREIGNEIKKEYKNKSVELDSSVIKEIIARKVVERMQAGKLILTPSGRRIPKKKLNIQNGEYNQKQIDFRKGCVGSFQVSGYKRADGTEVRGYTRNCGARHVGMSQEKRLVGQAKYAGKKYQDIPADELEDAISYFI